MRTLIVYDSLYGNTKAIAQAIAAATPGKAQVLPVGEADASALENVDLLIIGSPTHGALPTQAIQDFVQNVGAPTRPGTRAATFDTRLKWRFLERWGGFAAPKMADTLKGKGWALAGAPGGFFVGGLRKGPLKRGETDRAAAWARGLAEA